MLALMHWCPLRGAAVLASVISSALGPSPGWEKEVAVLGVSAGGHCGGQAGEIDLKFESLRRDDRQGTARQS